ncbi:MAG: polymerase sigma-B factor [Thermoleophilaceae bacterium]|nr:polymerase sigma-B factor [Thermoleophilaceae bacterium]
MLVHQDSGSRESDSQHAPKKEKYKLAGGRRLDEERRLFRAYLEQGDLGARERLVERFLPLARQLARRYGAAGEPLDDLTQVASLGLVKAIDRYELDRGTAFSSFAVPTILGEIKRHFRDTGWTLRVPRAIQERRMQVNRAIPALTAGLGRSPTTAEIAEHIDATSEEVVEAIEAAVAYEPVSLDTSPGSDEEDDTWASSVGAEDPAYDIVEYGATLEPALKVLTPRERLILHLRFVEDMTQSQIAEKVGISQMHVSRLIRKALETMRDATAA